jgi:cholesterol 24(S)-hydroxylase/benzoate 4-monooxygenase
LDFSSLHVLLTLDFIGEVAYGTDLHALSQGSDCRMLQLFDIILPELMKCGLFPLGGKFAVLQETRNMYRAIAELRGMAEKAVENARRREATSKEERGKNSSNKIFEILAEYACHKNPRRLAS